MAITGWMGEFFPEGEDWEDSPDSEGLEENFEEWPPEPEDDETSEELLTYEEQLVIRCVAEEAQHMSRQQLIQALVQCWGEKFAQRRALAQVAEEHDIPILMSGPMMVRQPCTKSQFKEALGYVPTAQQARAFLEDLEETATMELDMERIVDSVD